MSSVECRKDLADRVEKFLRAKHPQKTCDNVAAETGLKADRVGKWLEGTAPDGLAMTFLIAAYGPEFLAAVMPQRFEWIDESARRVRGERIDAEIAALMREREQLNAR